MLLSEKMPDSDTIYIKLASFGAYQAVRVVRKCFKSIDYGLQTLKLDVT